MDPICVSSISRVVFGAVSEVSVIVLFCVSVGSDVVVSSLSGSPVTSGPAVSVTVGSGVGSVVRSDVAVVTVGSGVVVSVTVGSGVVSSGAGVSVTVSVTVISGVGSIVIVKLTDSDWLTVSFISPDDSGSPVIFIVSSANITGKKMPQTSVRKIPKAQTPRTPCMTFKFSI
jgi:hypothetical protein